MTKSKRPTSAKQFDAAFDRGEDVTPMLDKTSAKTRHPIQRINIDIPIDILGKVDEEASRVGVARTALLKLWIAEHADRLTP